MDLPANADIRAGMFARGDFALGEGQGADRYRQEAVVVRDGFFHVFVVDGQQRCGSAKVQPAAA